MEPIPVTCCIVTYNSQAHIVDAIRSLLKYSVGVSPTIYVVDNASTDHTVRLVQKHFPPHLFPQVILLQNSKNLGLAAAGNLLLDRLDAPFHLVMNPDVRIRSDVLYQMARYLERHPDVGLLSPRVLYPDGQPQRLPKREPRLRYLLANRLPFLPGGKRLAARYAMEDKDLTHPVEVGMASGCFLFLRSSLFLRLGGFDEGYFLYFEDADLTRRMKKLAKAVYYPRAVVYHHWARESARNPKLLAIHLRSMLRFFCGRQKRLEEAEGRNEKDEK